MKFVGDLHAQHDAIVDAIKPLLGGLHPALQGSVLCDLLGMWLAGHGRDIQTQLLASHVARAQEFANWYRRHVKPGGK